MDKETSEKTEETEEISEATNEQEAEEEVAEQTEEESDETEETIYVFGDAEPEPEKESSTIKHLREIIKKKDKHIKSLEHNQPKEEDEIGPEPTLESCDMEESRFKREYAAYIDKKARIEAKKKESQDLQVKAQQDWEQKVGNFGKRKAEFMQKVPDFEEKEQIVVDSLGDRRAAAIVDVCDNSVEMFQALGSNPDKLKMLSESNDAQFLFVLGQLSKDMKTITRKPTTKPERVVKGDVTLSSGSVDREHERLVEKAKTGDTGPLFAYRKKLKAEGKPLPSIRK